MTASITTLTIRFIRKSLILIDHNMDLQQKKPHYLRFFLEKKLALFNPDPDQNAG
jgi:hypothetical protein